MIFAEHNGGIRGTLQSWFSWEITPLSAILPGVRQVEFWQVGQCPALRNMAKGNREALRRKLRKFAGRVRKRQITVCGGECHSYAAQRYMQHYAPETIFTGGYSLTLLAVFDFLLKRAHLWRKKDVVVLDADCPLGRFAALVLSTEAKLLLLTGADRGALELLGDEIFAKTGLAVRIVSEAKALAMAELAFLTGEAKKYPIPCLQWDLAAMAGERAYSSGAKINSRFLYPPYGKEKLLSAGWLSAMLLAQYEAKGKTGWQQKTPSEKMAFWQQGWQYFDATPVFCFGKENGRQFYRLFG